MAAVLNTTSPAYKAWLLRAKGPVVCAPLAGSSRGIWFLENPLSNAFAMYIFQFILVSSLTQVLHFVLRPLRQTKPVCYFLAGIILSPNVMGRFKIFKGMVFTLEEMMLTRTVGILGVMYFLFLLAVKTDLGLIRRNFREATLIGFLSVVAAYLAILALAFMFELPGINKGFFRALLAAGLSLTRFPNVAHTFNELNILSSELGNLAVSCTFVSEIIAWWWMLIAKYLWQPSRMALSIAYTVIIVIAFFLAVRPGIWFIIRMTPDGMPVKEGYILLILVGSLVFGFVTDLVGSMQLGMLIFGLIIPSGPPLGSTLAEKAELIISELLFPMYYVTVGYSINVFMLTPAVTIEIVVLVMMAALMKLAATALSGYFLCNIEFHHSLLLGLMLNIRGPYDTFLLFRWIVSNSIDRQAFSALALSDILLTAMVTPWIDIFYNPHARLSASTGKNATFFLTAPRNVELRVLCCIEAEENVPSIISLLEAMNPTKASPISAYVVHLTGLVGYATPVMLPYNRKMRRMASKGSSPIMRAFENYSRNSLGLVSARPYTVVSDYNSMHEYICRLALQEFIPLIIIPFQANRQTNAVEVTAMRIVNSNVQTYSPCTVGVLVNKGIHRFIQAGDFSLSAAIVFVSGNDDREALAFGIRMTGKPNLRVNLIRIVVNHQEAMSTEERAEKKLDDSMIDQFLEEKGKSEGALYQEIAAEDAGQVMQSLRGLDVNYNLIIVGRKRKNSLLAEDMMKDWSENPDLGVLGDLIASSDHYASTSVLVMQHFGDVNVKEKTESNEGEGEHLLRVNS